MKRIELSGIVSTDFEWPGYGPTIGGESLVDLLVENLHVTSTLTKQLQVKHGRYGEIEIGVPLTVIIAVHLSDSDEVERQLQFNGTSHLQEGDQGISEVTDWVLESMHIGGIDLLDQLDRLEGRHVTVSIDDGPPSPLAES